jgi:tetratricopeptide (TPR) repeat protein
VKKLFNIILYTIALSIIFINVNANAQDQFSVGKEEFKKGNYSKALSIFREIKNKQKKNPELFFLMGSALFNLDSLDAANIEFTQARELDEKNPQIYISIGDIYFKQNIAPAAIEQYKKAIEFNNGLIEAHIKLGDTYKKMKKWNDAVSEYLVAIQLDSTNSNLYSEVSKIYIKANQYKNASKILKKLTELKPHSLEVQSAYMKCLFEIKDYETVVIVADKVISLDSANVEAFRLKANSYTELKEYGEAEETFLKLKEKTELTAKDYLALGKVQHSQDKQELSIQSYETALKIDSTLSEAFSDLGALYMKQKRYSESAVMYEKKITVDSNSLSAYINASASYMQLKNYERSKELLKLGIEHKPTYLGFRLRLAQTYALMDSLDQAKFQYDTVLVMIGDQTEKYKNELSEAYNMIGTIYFQKNRYDAAVEILRKALNSGADGSQLRVLIGQALILGRGDDTDANRKRILEAVDHFRKAIKLDPKSIQGHLWLAQGLLFSRLEWEPDEAKKLTEEACKEFKTVLQYDPGNPDAKKGSERIGCH